MSNESIRATDIQMALDEDNGFAVCRLCDYRHPLGYGEGPNHTVQDCMEAVKRGLSWRIDDLEEKD